MIVLSISCLVGLVTKQGFVSRLRTLDPGAWERLHRPRIFTEWLFGSGAFMRFILKREYESLPDPKIVALGSYLRISLIVYGMSFVSFLILLAFL
jgi:hypothetical protein